MSRAWAVVACAALVTVAGGKSFGQVQHVKEQGDSVSVFYYSDDQHVGGTMANLSLNVSATFPPSEWVDVYYSGDECVIESCIDFYGNVFCNCDFFTMKSFGGYGKIPASALEVSPQGVARLAFDPAEIVDGFSDGECDGVELTFVPNGSWHWSENSQVAVETPADITRAVSHSDEWETGVRGGACGLTLEAEDEATGYLTHTDWNRIVRTVKEE